MLELISQVDIEPHLFGMVRVVESSFQWTKHTVYPIGNGATEHILFFHDITEIVAAQRIASGEAQIMDASHPLAELDTSDNQIVLHHFYTGGAGKRQLIG